MWHITEVWRAVLYGIKWKASHSVSPPSLWLLPIVQSSARTCWEKSHTTLVSTGSVWIGLTERTLSIRLMVWSGLVCLGVPSSWDVCYEANWLQDSAVDGYMQETSVAGKIHTRCKSVIFKMKPPTVRSRRRWEHNIKMGLKDTGLDVVVWINWFRIQIYVTTKMKFWARKRLRSFDHTFLDYGMKFNEFSPESLPQAPIFFTRIPVQLCSQTLHMKIWNFYLFWRQHLDF
jgi:hypothetical protein